MIYLWLGLIIILAFIEVSTVSLTTIWFIASAIVAAIVSLFVDSFAIQFGIFVLLGVLLLITTRKFLLRFISVRDVKTNFDRVIGEEGVVTEEITKDTWGEVKADGKRWTAVANTTIPVGSRVEILSIDGVKLKVAKKEED